MASSEPGSLPEDTLFSDTRISTQMDAPNPLIVVGLPRSGSSFASHVLSALPDYYVFDDLYLLRRAKEVGAMGGATPEQFHKLLFFLGWQIRARLRVGSYATPSVTEDEVEPMNDALRVAFGSAPVNVYELQREWLLRLAKRAGASRWGFKMPSAFRQLDALRVAYPDLKVVYNMRNPYDVLSSFKHLPDGSIDGDRRRYHPLFYAIYWRTAVRSYEREAQAHPEHVKLVLFEDLTQRPQQTGEALAAFLDVVAPETVSVPPKPNSSHGKTRKSLTGLETWLVSLLCGREMTALGYEKRAPNMKLGDLWDLLRVSFTFVKYRLYTLPRKTKASIAAAGDAQTSDT